MLGVAAGGVATFTTAGAGVTAGATGVVAVGAGVAAGATGVVAAGAGVAAGAITTAAETPAFGGRFSASASALMGPASCSSHARASSSLL